MSLKGNYNTKQRQAVLSYIEQNADSHVTAAQIAQHFKTADNPIGTATIYRQLEKLVSDAVVRKYVTDGQSSACFQYVGPKKECAEHFHLKCEGCGELTHLRCSLMDNLSRHVQKEHTFEINSMRTVFYGKCESCAKNDAAAESAAAHDCGCGHHHA